MPFNIVLTFFFKIFTYFGDVTGGGGEGAGLTAGVNTVQSSVGRTALDSTAFLRTPLKMFEN